MNGTPHQLLLQIVGLQHRKNTDPLMSYVTALEKTGCESVETTIRKRHLHLARAVQRTTTETLNRRVMSGTMADGESPGPGRPEENWAQCLADHRRVFQATEGSPESSCLVFG